MIKGSRSCSPKKLFSLVIKHTVTVSFKVGVGYLLAEFLADALIFLRSFKAAGAISTRPFKTFFYAFYNFLILIKRYL